MLACRESEICLNAVAVAAAAAAAAASGEEESAGGEGPRLDVAEREGEKGIDFQEHTTEKGY
jgi:hypothetical protein